MGKRSFTSCSSQQSERPKLHRTPRTPSRVIQRANQQTPEQDQTTTEEEGSTTRAN